MSLLALFVLLAPLNFFPTLKRPCSRREQRSCSWSKVEVLKRTKAQGDSLLMVRLVPSPSRSIHSISPVEYGDRSAGPSRLSSVVAEGEPELRAHRLDGVLVAFELERLVPHLDSLNEPDYADPAHGYIRLSSLLLPT